MNKTYNTYYEMCEELFVSIKLSIVKWTKTHIFGIFVFNLSIVLLLLLRSAGYFHPFYILTVNKVIFMTMVLSVILLGARHRTIFMLALVFWFGAFIFKVVNIDIWSERMGIYTYEAFTLGVLLLLAETFIMNRNGKTKNN